MEWHRRRLISPYLLQYAFVFAFGIDWKTRRRIPPIHASTNTTALAYELASPLAVGFRGAALPERRLRLGSLTTSVNQPERGGGAITPTSLALETLPWQSKRLICKVTIPHSTRQSTVSPFAKLNICPFRRNTVVRPSNDEMGAVTLQSALGNPTLQQRLLENLRLIGVRFTTSKRSIL